METILVTGGAGFIGSCFVRQCIAEQMVRVVNLDKLTYAGNLDSLGDALDDPRHVFVRGDIVDQATVDSAIAKYEPDGDCPLSRPSRTSIARSTAPPSSSRTNVQGTFQLLDAARHYAAALAGRSAVGLPLPARLHRRSLRLAGARRAVSRETSPYDPSSPYSASKAAADHFARAYFRTFGLPVLVTNCSNNYGPCQFPEKLIPLMILNALEGKPLPVYGDGQNVRDWLFVEDHCRALWRVLTAGRPGETYNIGGNCEQKNIDVVRTICDTVDELRPGLPHAPCSSLITFVQDRPGHDRRYAIDAGKIRQELGWQPEHEFSSGMRRTVQWYLDNSQWVARVSSGAYRRERLGLLREPA